MLHAPSEVFFTALLPRLVLLVNHVLAAEPVATERLRQHAGRQLAVRFDGWPALLPRPPQSRFMITPAGLLEWLAWQPLAGAAAAADAADAGPAMTADLQIGVDASNPARLLAGGLFGRRPVLSVAGDAALAADVSWVVDNVRWDIRDDLSRLLGDWPARELARGGAAAAQALRSAVRGLVQRATGRSAAPADAGYGGEGDGAAPAPPPAR